MKKILIPSLLITLPVVLLIIFFLPPSSPPPLPGEPPFLHALRTIPAKYFGDITLDRRETLFLELNSDSDSDTRRLDAAKGWLSWYGTDSDTGATSAFYAKELPRPDGKSPLIFIHMPKPYGRGKLSNDQTFVLEFAGNRWKDVTKSVVPFTIDITMHFVPKRDEPVIQVARWKEYIRPGGPMTYTHGERIHDLRWTGSTFVIDEPASNKLTAE